MPPRRQQLSRADIENMSTEDVADAFAAGRFADLLAGNEPEDVEADPQEWIETLASLPDDELERLKRAAHAPAAPGSADQGARGRGGAGQIRDRAALGRMRPDEITAALRDGRLDEMLGRDR